MKKWICMIMAVLMLLAGCGEQSQTGEDKEQPVPVGTWQTDLEICDLVNDQVANLEEMNIFFLVDTFVLDLELTFRDDGTYTLKLDEESVQTAAEHLETMAEEYLLLGLEEQLMGLQDEQMGDDLEATYQEITMEQMLEQEGTTLEEMKKQLRETLNMEAMKAEILAQTNLEGTFKAEDGVLYLSADMQSEINENTFIVYTVEKDALTFEEYYSSENEMEAAYLFPLDWQKVK